MSAEDERWMRRALELAKRGEGVVEPNPMVGCVLVRDGRAFSEGWHRRCGGPHAEIEALGGLDPQTRLDATGATAYVTLEPCSHFGRTPPCADALIEAGVARVVAAIEDPFPEVQGSGLQRLRDAGVAVKTGVLADEARQLMAPYLNRVLLGRPWVIAKWAMTLDGKIATSSGDSQWISNAASREQVHRLRSRVDAVIVGSGTALADNPRLTARVAGELNESNGGRDLPQPTRDKQPTRIVCDRRLRLPLTAQLVATTPDSPVIIATSVDAPHRGVEQLQAAGCEVLQLSDKKLAPELLQTLGRRQMTNVLLEGGATLIGAFLDARLVDEVWVFIAPKLVGGAEALTAVGGDGVTAMADALQLSTVEVESMGGDIWVRGRLLTSP